MSGYKTYIASAAMVVCGLGLAFLVGGTATYADPAGDYSAVVGKMVGAVAVLMGLRDVSMRHAIQKLERKLDGR